MKQMMNLPEQVRRALARLEDAGYEAFVVGGAVRDHVRGADTGTDWDITTSALPEETEAVFAGYRVIETGMKHGTVTVLLDGEPLEITTYRVDGGYSDHRHPDEVRFTRSLREDLRRRDFTMNAMAYSPRPGWWTPSAGRRILPPGWCAAWASRTGGFRRTRCASCGRCASRRRWAWASTRTPPGRPGTTGGC